MFAKLIEFCKYIADSEFTDPDHVYGMVQVWADMESGSSLQAARNALRQVFMPCSLRHSLRIHQENPLPPWTSAIRTHRL